GNAGRKMISCFPVLPKAAQQGDPQFSYTHRAADDIYLPGLWRRPYGTGLGELRKGAVYILQSDKNV
ncbi:MAG: hypothetical protein ACLSAP_13065, partial [Oscillospiraceae bacterium]